jgi:3-oxoacyl-[acyl-carrier-protein] synthase-3
MLATEPALGPALCVTADRFPPGARYEQAYNAISDGASACMLSREARGYRLVASHHITNGALAVATDDQTAGAFFSYMHRLVAETCAVARITAGDLRWIVTQNTYRPA